MGTVRAELAFPLENRGWGAAAVARGVEEAALALGVAGLLDRSTHELSGGELQRVALGAALAGRPRLLLLDEPTSQLDPVAGDELLGVLRRVNEEWGTAVVLAEHRLERCLAAADRVIALEDGAISIDADPRGFLEQAPPALQTPGARLFAAAGLTPPPVAVKDARAALRARGLGGTAAGPVPADAPPRRARLRRRPKAPVALAFDGVWLEIPRGPAVLRGVELAIAPGERVALMGRNGAGKSTLLRLAAGLTPPTRGRIERAGRVSLLLQNPGDYLVAERVGEELPSDVLEAAGLASLADRHPRDLSGGQRQRLALAIVLQGEPPAVVCLDEPTRGMDRGHKDALAAHLRELAAQGCAVLVATHDAEFAALWAERTVLLGDGAPVADAPTAEVLGGGWYFATQTARILGGCALLPEEGAALLRAAASGGRSFGRRRAAVRGPRRQSFGGRSMSWVAASLLVLGLALAAGFAWYERAHPTSRVLALVATLAALAALGRIAFAPLPNVKPTTDIVLLTGYALGGAPGFAVGAVAALASNVFFGQGPWTPWQMCAWGAIGVGGAMLARVAGRELGRASLAVACGLAGAFFGAVMNLSLWVTFSGDHSLAKLGAYFVTSLPFDLAHVVGNVAFCLVFGPALVRALSRYRQRFEVSWRPAPALAAATLAAVVLAGAAPPKAEAATPLAWLQNAQNSDGGFGADTGQRSTGLYSGWAGLGLAAAGRNPRDLKHDLDRLRPRPPARRQRPRRDRPHDPAPPRRGPEAEARQPRPRQGGARQAPPQRLVRQPRQHDLVRDLRPPRRGPRRQRRQDRRPLDREPGEPRRRLQLRGQGRRLRDRRHRRRAAGARRRGPQAHPDRPPRRALPRPAPEPRRRLPAPARRPVERAVDGVGGPGARRRRPQPRPPEAQRREVSDRLPALAHHPERQGALLPHQQPDAGVGHRPGGRRARPQAVPARPGAAGEEGGAARRRPPPPRPRRPPRRRPPSRARRPRSRATPR